MILLYKTSSSSKNVSLLSFRQRLSYLLVLLFVLSSFNPAQAGMAMGQGMMTAAMDMSVSGFEPVMDINGCLLSQGLADTDNSTDNSGHTMSQDEDCQSDCDCCPGLCSAYLPSYLNTSAFLPLRFTLAGSAIQRKVSASTSLFRPPISH